MCSSDLFPSHDMSAVMYDESLDGDLIQCDMTQILLNQEKYRRLLGDMNVQSILAQMHPTQSTIMDGMTDEERFACVISRHCQTMSERQAVLRQLAIEKSELSAYAESMLAETKAAPSTDSAPDRYRDWETDRKSTRLNSSHITRSRMPSSA